MDIAVLFTINFSFGIALIMKIWIDYFLLMALLLGNTVVVVYPWLLIRILKLSRRSYSGH